MSELVPVPARSRLVGLDGTRGFACLCVLAVHTIGQFAPSYVQSWRLWILSQAIVFFFALSGFLIFLPFVRRYAAEGHLPSIRHFAGQRIRRVYPAYVVTFLIANFVFAAVFLTNAVETGRPPTDAGSGRITDPLRLLEHLTLVQNFIPSELQTGNNPSWSLTTELTFYLVLPLLALAMFSVRAHGHRARMLVALVPGVLMLVVGIAGKLWARSLQSAQPHLTSETAEFGSNGVSVLSRSLLGLADNFAFGMIAAVLFVWMERGHLGRLSPTVVRIVCPIVWAASLLWAVHLDADGSRFIGTFIALSAGAYLLFVVEPAARGRISKVGALVDIKPLYFIGQISLSIYLWHFPVILVVSRLGWGGSDSIIGGLWSLLLVGGVSIALGALTYRLVEVPGMRLGRRVRPGVAA
jgi:peptidoglycan/LPS O-acetylase OafA/YrhL